MEEHIRALAQKIADYHRLNHTLEKSDCILVLGSNDLRVAERGAQLWLEGWAPIILFSGNAGVLTRRLFNKPEAELFAEAAQRMGVPADNILLETRSTNTGENIQFSRELLMQRSVPVASIILVQKPYMERRAYATFKKVWPEPRVLVTSPPLELSEYATPLVPMETVLNVMVGDLQRIKVYAERGFQIAQPIPAEVWEAYEQMVALGFDKHLVK